MLEGGSIANHLNEFHTITNQLSSVGFKFDDKVSAHLILCSLLERWNGLIMVVSNYVSGSNTFKFDDVVGIILSEEMWRKSIGETSSNALTIESRGRQRERGKILGNQNKSRMVRSKSRLGKVEFWERGNLKKY